MDNGQLLENIENMIDRKFKEELTPIREDIHVLKEDVGVLKEDVRVLKEDVSGLKEDVSGLKEDVSGLKEDVRVLKKDVSGLKEDVSGLKKDEGEAPSGMLAEVLENFAETVNLEVSYTFCEPTDDVAEVFQNGDYDCVIGMPLSSSYCANAGIIRSYNVTDSDFVLLTKPGSTREKNDTTIAIDKYLIDQINLNEYKEVVLCDTTADCLKAVRQGKADVTIANRAVAAYYNFEAGDNLATTSILGSKQQICIGFCKELDTQFIA